MASLLSVFVLFLAQQVFARECPALAEIKNCNDCIRCHGIWCNKPDQNGVQCAESEDKGFCPQNQEKLLIYFSGDTFNGSEVSPKYLERSLVVGQEDTFRVTFQKNVKAGGVPKVTVKNSNFLTSQHLRHTVNPIKRCDHGNCTATITVRPTTDFCPETGSNLEFFELKVQIEGVSEEVTAKYHVPCACECSLKEKVEVDSTKCNGNGEYLGCGSCDCRDGWTGPNCETKIRQFIEKPSHLHGRDCDRGDTPMECIVNDMICSNHGNCSCGTCECDPGYLGNYCEDICQYTANNCDSCILIPKAGYCSECPLFNMIVDNANETLLKEYDWTKCNLTETDCYIEYMARVDDNGEIHVMVTRSCNGIAINIAGNPINVTVPMILGVVAVIAAATAVAGYIVWKTRTPPVPLTDPKYENVDAEDCTGINPLYKPPTSSFKNPQYGNKW